VKLYLSYLLVTLFFAALWWLLTGGLSNSWIVGVPVVIVASWSAWQLGMSERWLISVSGLLRFVPLFLWESMRGGINVARRTLAARIRIEPTFTVYRSALEQQSARVFFANCVCLLPGTLAVDLQGERLKVHLLDASRDPHADLRRLEQAVAIVYQQKDFEHGSPSR
jgi:multicomponent Na+:H+ antiporter subunit E